MQIITGVMPKATKAVLYGPEGIGKTSFAAKAPNPLFIDTEGSTTRLNVRRLPAPQSFAMVMEQIQWVIYNPQVCGTLVVDTADWAQRLATDAVCAKLKVSGIEDMNYGKGFVYVYEDIGRMLNLLDQVVDRGINVILTAHAAMRKFEQPDEMGSYDRWELKLNSSQKCSIAGMVKEWADMVLFANYETIVVKNENKKGKAQGGQRVMYTTHHPCWDAKNRFDLPEKLPFDYEKVAHCFLQPAAGTVPAPQAVPEPVTTPVEAPPADQPSDPYGIPPALLQLMKQYNVQEQDIQRVVAMRGYYPESTPIRNYDPQFVEGVLVGAWQQVYNMIEGA